MASNSKSDKIDSTEMRMIILWLLNSLKIHNINNKSVCQRWNSSCANQLIITYLKQWKNHFYSQNWKFPKMNKMLLSSAISGFNFDFYRQLLRTYGNFPKSIGFMRKSGPENHQIIIIGAGMAGMGAALTLFKSGYTNIKILEAEKEPGGRLKTIQLQDGIVELGAQWIHGKDNNCLYTLAKEHNLLSDETSEEGCGLYIRDDGFVFNSDLVNEVRLEIEKITTECEKFVNESTYPYSFGDFLEESFQSYLNNCTDDSKDLLIMKQELFDWHIRFLLVDNSCRSLKDLSAKEWGRYVDGTENINLKNGYKSLVNILLQMLPRQIVCCNCPVSKITWGDMSNAVKIYCLNGQVFHCDHVIMTASLGYLKNFQNIFQPPLPYTLQKSIESMGFYGIGKIFLIFKYKWWNGNGFQLIWSKNLKLNKISNWTRSITGFDVVYNQSNILLGWVSGEGVLEMENLSESEVGADCVHILQRFLRRSIPEPIKTIKSSWMSSTWFKGAYSHITPHCDKVKTGPNTLSKVVSVRGVPKILLAGEACSPAHFSTTHGAFESGQAQAQVLVNFLK